MKYLLLFGLVTSIASARAAEKVETPAGYRLLYAAHFGPGIDRSISQQKATEESLAVVEAPGGQEGKCLRVTMRQTDDYSKVANGSPRSELAFGRQFHFEQGKDYVVEWSTFIPRENQFDTKQPESISQIHHGLRKGSPPFLLGLYGNEYTVELRGGEGEQIKASKHRFGSAAGDRGLWVKWKLHYLPDATGQKALTQLFKNGVLVVDSVGEANAYAGDQEAYWKLGVYKWGWKKQPTDVETRTMFYGDVIFAVKE